MVKLPNPYIFKVSNCFKQSMAPDKRLALSIGSSFTDNQKIAAISSKAAPRFAPRHASQKATTQKAL
jgi:hypothetical protein